MRTRRFVVTDVFTDTPLTGNQLAVFTDARDLDEATMQALALEVGFSETVFVFPPESGGTVRIRIFTPYFELPFAGHPTLGTAFVLGAPLQLEVIVLETGRGHVPVALERDESGRIVFGRMAQPVPSVSPFTATDELFAALGVEGSELPAELYDNGATFVFVGVRSEAELAALQPSTAGVSALGFTGAACFAGSGTAWTSRMFWAGGEDAATGAAAGPARVSPRPPRPHRLGRRDHDLAGGGDRPSVDPLRARRRRRRADRPRRGRRAGGDSRAGGVQVVGNPGERLKALSGRAEAAHRAA